VALVHGHAQRVQVMRPEDTVVTLGDVADELVDAILHTEGDGNGAFVSPPWVLTSRRRDKRGVATSVRALAVSRRRRQGRC